MPQLTVYQILPGRRGDGDLARAIDPEVLPSLRQYSAKRAGYEARLFLAEPTPGEPDWVGFLRPAFPDIQVPDSASNGGVLVVKLAGRGSPVFALTFGTGRFLLRAGSFKRGYGLRTALNALLGHRNQGTARMKGIDLRTVGAQTLHTRHQASRDATFDAFGMDVQRDLLGAVTGPPVAPGLGSRITGSDAVTINPKVTVDELGEMCRDLFDLGNRTDYKRDFEWVDDVHVVSAPELIEALELALVARLEEGANSGFALAPPEIVDWDAIRDFRFTFATARMHRELTLQAYLDTWASAHQGEPLTVTRLRLQRLEALDGSGNVVGKWTVFRCLDGEVEYQGKRYLLSDGDFFEVSTTYQRRLDRDLQDIEESRVRLPASVHVNGREESEDAYNRRAATQLRGLLLDKQTVKIGSHATPIEVCDILTSDRRFIHVKRHLASATLSHLFAQGAVSADLFLMSQDYRRSIRSKIAGITDCPQARRRQFSRLIDVDRPSPGHFEVIYAIVADWRGRSLADALPFFSKVNLRRHAQDLRRMGYRVGYRRVDIERANRGGAA